MDDGIFSLSSNPWLFLQRFFFPIKYVVFIAPVEICIYMFNKTSSDLLLPVGCSVNAFRHSCFGFYSKYKMTEKGVFPPLNFCVEIDQIEEGCG